MIKHFFKATGYACQGLKALWLTELAFQCEVIASIVLLPLAWKVAETPVARALLMAVVLLVLVVEAINSSIEKVVDRIGLEQHPLSGLAKDIAASAVLLSIGNAVVVWAVVLLG